MDIWEENMLIALLTSGHLEAELDNTANIKRAKKQMMKYHWSNDTLFFQNLVVRRPLEHRMLLEKIHEKIRHFGAMQTLVEVLKRFFWHAKTKAIKKFIRDCENCQLTKQSRNMRFGIKEMKSIPICNLFYRVTLDTTGPLPKITNGNKYVFVVIDHYSKWCEARPIKEHDAYNVVEFLKDEVICRYGVPKYILTDNGSEWMKEYAEIC
jgi:hypothetical protein